jgi:hypothetical protein
MTQQQSLPSIDSRVRFALEQIRALRKLTRETGTHTTLTQNNILRALTPEVLTAVALELAKDGKQ